VVGWVEGGAHAEKLVARAPGGYYVLYHSGVVVFFFLFSFLRFFLGGI
jgi:hypothetical protein